MAWTLEELKAEKERRKASPQGAPTAPGQKPQGGTAAGTQEGTDLVDVLQETGSAYARNVLEKAEGNLNLFTTPQRFILNKALEASGSGRRVPEFDITQFTDEALAGGQVKDPGLRNDINQTMETATDLIELGAAGAGAVGLTKATGKALARGAGRVLGKGKNAASGARGASGKPHYTAQQVKAGEHLGGGAGAGAGGYAAGAVQGAGVAGLTGQDPLVGAAMGMAVNNPLGRWMMSRAAGKVFGDKARALTYVGSHPATRRAATNFKKALKDRMKGDK